VTRWLQNKEHRTKNKHLRQQVKLLRHQAKQLHRKIKGQRCKPPPWDKFVALAALILVSIGDETLTATERSTYMNVRLLLILALSLLLVGASSPETLASCTTSGATGAGTQTRTINVGPPVANQGDSWAIIQNAINNAASSGGGKVVLEAGTYWITRTINVGSNVHLAGAGQDVTILKACPQCNVGSMVSTNRNSNITVENMTIDQNAANGRSTQQLSKYLIEARRGSNIIFQRISTRLASTYSMVAINTTRFCFRNNDIRQDGALNGRGYNQHDGIHVMAVDNVTTSNGDVRNNFVDNAFGGSTVGDDALVARGWQGGTVRNVSYTGNVSRAGIHGGAMAVWTNSGTVENITVSNNEFWGNVGVGLVTHPSTSGAFRNSIITQNILHNQRRQPVINGSGLTVTGNYQCATPPITVRGTGNTANNNPVYTGCTDAPSTTTPPPLYPPIL
jgi:hypothetical protein